MVKGIHFNRLGAYAGLSFSTFSLGVSIGRFGASLDLGFIWFSLEW